MFISPCEHLGSFTYNIGFFDIDPRYPNDSIFRITIKTFPEINKETYGYNTGRYTHITPVQFLDEETSNKCA